MVSSFSWKLLFVISSKIDKYFEYYYCYLFQSDMYLNFSISQQINKYLSHHRVVYLSIEYSEHNLL